MTTITINEKTIVARKMLEFLKTQPYVTIINEPNADTLKAINEVKAGKVTKCKDSNDLFNKLGI